MALIGTTNEEKIWNFLYINFPNKYSVAGIMGNLYAESTLKPNNLQDTFNKKLNMTDEEYTQAVDKTSYHNFIRDGAGYGIAQWSFWPRKQALLKFAHEQGVSISNLEMQLKFLVKELLSYENIAQILKNPKSIQEVSDIILTEFEAPIDQSEQVKKERASYGKSYYDKFSGNQVEIEREEIKSLINFYKNSKYAKYYLSNNKSYISNMGSDEENIYISTTIGNTDERELQIRSWYNQPWTCIIRHPDKNIALKIAELNILAAESNKIKYIPSERNTYWQTLRKNKYNPENIVNECGADCSSIIIANVRAVGYLLNISELKDLAATSTDNMKDNFIKAGFKIYKDPKLLNSPKYLFPGDILLDLSHHIAAVNLTLGKENTIITTKVNPNIVSNNTNFKINNKGDKVKNMQEMLITIGYSCGKDGANGIFNKDTLFALKTFQGDNCLAADGIYNFKTEELLKQQFEEKKSIYFESYPVKVTAKSLNVRQIPSKKGAIIDKITDQGIYMIVDKKGPWGKLESGLGWISLSYTEVINE